MYATDKAKAENAYQEYLDFLDDDNSHGVMSKLVKEMIRKQECRLIVNINDLRRWDKQQVRARALLNSSIEELIAFEKAFRDYVDSIEPDYQLKVPELFIGLEGSFGAKHVTPRTLNSNYLGQIACIEGIVTKLSLVRPKVLKSVHFCPATKKMIERKYTDITSYDAYPSSTVYPTKDEDGNLLETEFGLSTYKDHQTFTLQEMPEKAPAGQLPRSVDIIADNDLVDQCKPGDRVQVVGTFRCLPSKKYSYTSGTFRTVLLANNVIQMSKEVDPSLSAQDIKMCQKFANTKNKNVFNELARSLAPSIHGHEYIKKALLCMLLGGVEKILPNGSRIRGDINILLVGDPSVAKSQMLRYVLGTAPRAIATTGRGSSGVGLTAAVTNDFETGERRLEAGAMVLADRGVVCIDEFDKMSDIDRTAIHEVMEQGRVTITKAGIHAKLNARCSVLAAANPVYGKYDEYKTPMDNIGLQDSLLSRFDLLFILLDKHEREIDTQISDHVIRMHRYRAANEEDGEPLPIISTADFLTTHNIEDEEMEEENETEIYEKFDNLLYANRSKKDKIISVKFMKKYIHIAKQFKPILTDQAATKISEAYSELRSYDQEHTDMAKTQPVTARCLETMIRLATAHAKARLSKDITVKDAEAAIELVQFAIFKKVISKPRKRRPRDDGEGSETEESEDEHYTPSKRKPVSDDPYKFTESHRKASKDEPHAGPSGYKISPLKTAPTEDTKVSEENFKKLQKALMTEFRKHHAQSLPVIDFKAAVEQMEFSEREIYYCLSRMQDENKIMLSDNVIFLI